jgi:SAM-dependent methyltransferase
MSNRFDARFYRRFYKDTRTRVTTPEEMRRRGAMVGALVRQLELPVKRILDAGCGLGWLRPPLVDVFPNAAYVGLEVSEHLCEQHGWVCESLATYRPRGRFDLIICYDVLQYLSDREAARAMANLARLSRGALYFHALTLEDWRGNVDRDATDGEIHLRAATWYRTRLARYFKHAGFGVHVRRGVPWGQWELERARPLDIAPDHSNPA